MEKYQIIFEAIIVFIIIYIANYFLLVRKNTKFDAKKVPVEVLYLSRIYNINIKNINYKNLVRSYSLLNTIIMTTVYIIVVYLVKGVALQIIIGFVLLILLIIIGYGILGRYYEKKGSKENV